MLGICNNSFKRSIFSRCWLMYVSAFTNTLSRVCNSRSMMLADACADVISNDSIIAIPRKGLSLIIIVVGRS